MMKISRMLPALGLLLCTVTLQGQPSIGGYHVYYGLLHNHSQVSDGVGSPDQAYRYAHEQGLLDFFALTDHSEQIHGDEWNQIRPRSKIHVLKPLSY